MFIQNMKNCSICNIIPDDNDSVDKIKKLLDVFQIHKVDSLFFDIRKISDNKKLLNIIKILEDYKISYIDKNLDDLEFISDFYAKAEYSLERDSYVRIGVLSSSMEELEILNTILSQNGFIDIRLYTKEENSLFQNEILLISGTSYKHFAEYVPCIFINDVFECDKNIIEKINEIKNDVFNQYSKKFYSRLLHKIKNPLAILSGQMQLMESRISTESKAFKSFLKMKEQVKILMILLEKVGDFVLDFENESEILDIRKFLGEFKTVIEKRFPDFDLKIDYSKPFVNFEGDIKLLNKIFEKIVENYAEEKETGSMNVELDQNNDFFVFKFLSEEKIMSNHVNNMFVPFFSIKKGENLGLGLNQVRKILAGCGGRIKYSESFDDKYGFVVEIPKKY